MGQVSRQEITLVKGAIHNPNEPRHFMTFTNKEGKIKAVYDDLIIASAEKYWLMQEVAHVIISPVIYFHRQNVEMKFLRESNHRTNCPLKGQAHYYDLFLRGEVVKNIAWSYPEPIAAAKVIAEFLAFDQRAVDVSTGSRNQII